MIRPGVQYFSAILLLVVLLLSPSLTYAQGTARDETKLVSQRYLEVDTGLRYDELRMIYADSAQFSDPTGDVFQGPVSQGVIQGADRIIAIQRGWGLGSVEFKPDVSFYVGEYAVHRGTYRGQYRGSTNTFQIPFVTIHRVQDGLVQERIDFGEYIRSFDLGTRFDANTNQTETVAEEYLQAYLNEDLDTQRRLMAEDVVFQDPTSKVYGPPSGELYSGADQLLERRAQIYQNISNFSFDTEKRFVANHHAVYMGHAVYEIANGLNFRQPAIFVIEVRNGKVTRHWDFVDYTVGPS